MTVPTPGRRIHARAASGALAILLALSAVPAESQEAGAPHFPTSLSPSGGTVEARHGRLRTIEWNQLIATGPTVRPNPAYFVICLKPYLPSGLAPSCGPGDATWTESIASPSTALRRDGSRFTFVPPAGSADGALDRPMRLAVGACTGFACSYASAAVWYSTKDIVAARPAPAPSTDSLWVVDLFADNLGSTAIGQYSGHLGYWEVLTEPWAGTYICAWNVNAPEYRYDTTIWTIDERGTVRPIIELPRVDDRYVGIPIAGLMRIGAPYRQRSFLTGSAALPPGEIADVRVATVALPVPSSGGQRAYVLVARHDTTDVIREPNDVDNSRARCVMR